MEGSWTLPQAVEPEGFTLLSPVDGTIALPAESDFLRADFNRAGPDLVIETPEGAKFLVVDYFMNQTPPVLNLADGGVLNPAFVARLAGPVAPDMVAQNIGENGLGIQFSGLGEPIGQVSEMEGSVQVTHANGTNATLGMGDNIFQGDVLETGAGGSVSVVFVDDTVFSLDENGQMVMDEMVYDPDTQTGVFNAEVVQGVFSFVSGKVAKTSPDGMEISMPSGTIGIRGSTVLLFVGPDGSETKVTLVEDVDGNIGEVVISNDAGTLVLNNAGASTSLFGADVPPTPVVILTQTDIQKDYGKTLTKLVKVVAQQAQQQAQRAEQQAQQADQNAQQAQQQAQQSEEEAAAAAQEAEAAAAAAAAAEEAAATGDEAAIAEAAAAKAAAEKAAAEAEAKAAAAAAAAEEAAQAEQQAAEAAAQAEQVSQFSSMANTAAVNQEQVFTQFVQTGFVDPALDPNAPPPDGQPGPDGQPQDQPPADQGGDAGAPPPDGDAAAQAAYEEAIAAGATPAEAFEAAAMAASGGNMDDPAVAAARAAFEEALANGATPEEAMLAAQAAVVAFDQQTFIDPNAPPPDGTVPPPEGFVPPPEGFVPPPTGTISPDIVLDYGLPGLVVDPVTGELVPADTLFGDWLPDGSIDPITGLPAIDPITGLPIMDFMPGDYLPGDYLPGDYLLGDYLPGDYVPLDGGGDYYYPIVEFGKTIVMPSSSFTAQGDSGNTNFYFHWPTLLSGTATLSYTVTDLGGINQISFDSLDNMHAIATVGADGLSGTINMYVNVTSGGTHQATVSYSNISQMLLSDINVSALAINDFWTGGGDVLVFPTMASGQTGYVVAATDAATTLTISTANYANITHGLFFAKGGGDTINITMSSGDLMVIGGVTATDNTDSNSDGSPDANLNVFSYAGVATHLSVSMYSGGGTSLGGDAFVMEIGNPTGMHHDLWDVGTFTSGGGNDSITINSGSYNTVTGGTGNDTITVWNGVKIANIQGGDGTDSITVDWGVVTDAATLTIDGGVDTTTDSLVINTFSGGTIDLTTVAGKISNFNTLTVTGSNASAGLVVTAMNSTLPVTTLDGSAFSDTLNGGTGNDILQGKDNSDTLSGGAGNDTLIGGRSGDQMSGGLGVDTFKYTATDELGDSITDFVAGTDKFNFTGTAFNNLTAGALNAANFIAGAGATAATATQYFVYDTTSKNFYFDADGSGAGTQSLIANLTGITGTLAETDITIV